MGMGWARASMGSAALRSQGDQPMKRPSIMAGTEPSSTPPHSLIMVVAR